MFDKFNKMKTHHQTVFAILILFAIISFWRGLQGLMDIYLYPGNRELSLWVSIFLGLIILIGCHYATS